MSSVTSSLRAPRFRAGAALERLGEEGLLVTVCALFAAFVGVSAAPYMLWGDSWLTFLGGREIAQHGLPGIDTLTDLSRGREWIDQQWLAQLATYRLEAALGITGVVAVFAGVVVAPFLLACGVARARRASPRSVAVFALLGAPAFLCAVRAQAFAYFLFVPFVALLAAEGRRPSRRVWLAFPLLVLWANVHGSVLVAAALVALLGATELVARRARLRALALLVLPWPCVFASPYGLSLAGYYGSTAGNPLFKKFIEEWGPPSFPTTVGVPFFLTAAVALVLVARRPRTLTRFELGALALTLLGGLTAQRSIAWFSYAALLFLPEVLDECWPQAPSTARLRRLLAGVAATTVVLGLAATASAGAQAGRRIEAVWPRAALDAVRSALATDPSARILPAEGTADWLLYELPEVRGRIAFDGRFEVYSRARFAQIRNYLRQSGPGWERFGRRYRIVVVDPERNANLFRTYSVRRVRLLYRGPRVAVFDRGPTPAAAPAGRVPRGAARP